MKIIRIYQMEYVDEMVIIERVILNVTCSRSKYPYSKKVPLKSEIVCNANRSDRFFNTGANWGFT